MSLRNSDPVLVAVVQIHAANLLDLITWEVNRSE